MRDRIFSYIDLNREKVIGLLREMIQVPSPTYHEGDFAEFVEEKLKDLGMKTSVDSLGDVTGVMEAEKDPPLFLLNTHLDHERVLWRLRRILPCSCSIPISIMPNPEICQIPTPVRSWMERGSVSAARSFMAAA